MRRGVPGIPNGILSCPVLPMPLALVTFGGSPISASRTVVVSVFLRCFTNVLAKVSKSQDQCITNILHNFSRGQLARAGLL